jgi:NADH-quinone oxidoreductase subunit G
MPEIVIDGKKLQAENGATVLATALENGIDIPHFCWHPELSISGNCRMCLVEVGLPKRLPDGSIEQEANGNPVINYFPKLQIACATFATEGMHVRTTSQKVKEAQESVMEFILINHPLDCPICDEAGQCKLQEYAFKHSRGESSFDEAKNRAKKRQSWGPNVMYDAERCISCSRCIRFAQEVAKQDVLTFVNRGDHVTIQLFKGKELDGPYSMNVIDICPVGALTSKDFRFKSRVWDMSFNDSISPCDSTGSNIQLGIRNNEILRIDPKTNRYVNGYWISDYTRLNGYKFVNENRVIDPEIKGKGKVSWDEAYTEAASLLKKFKPEEIMVFGSPKATNEDNYTLKRFAEEVLKTPNIGFLNHIDDKVEEDEMLIVKDKAPNSAGAEAVGLKTGDGGIAPEELAGAINSGKIKALYLMEEDFEFHPEMLKAIDKLKLLIVHAYNHTDLTKKADVLIATSTYAEIEGTFTNKDKRVQHFEPALVTNENRRIMGMKMSRLDKFGAFNDKWTQHEIRNCRQSWRSIMNIANLLGAKWDYKKSEQIFDEIAEKIESFKDMNYDKLIEFQGSVLDKGDNPDPKLWNYQSHYMTPVD